MSADPQTDARLVSAAPAGQRCTPLWDSAWFRALLFSGTALLALELVSFKYGPRQAQLERQHQGRQFALADGAQGRVAGQGRPVPDFRYSTSESPEIGLRPLWGAAWAGLLVAASGMFYSRHKQQRRVDGSSAP